MIHPIKLVFFYCVHGMPLLFWGVGDVSLLCNGQNWAVSVYCVGDVGL